MDKINQLLEIIAETIVSAKKKEQGAGLNLWPIPTPQGMVFWGNEWAKKLNSVLHKVDEIEIPSSRLAHILWRIDAVKNSDLSREEKLYTIQKLFDILSNIREDIFCSDGKNIMKNFKAQNYNFEKNQRKRYFNFRADIYSYNEMIYWANPPLGYSFHGPYKTNEGKIVVREYYDLKPEVWNFTKNLNFSQVQILELYPADADIKIDFFERQIQANANPISFALKVDGKDTELRQLNNNLESIIQKGTKFINALNIQQLIEKHADYWFYALKPLCESANEDWHVPENVKDNIYKRYYELNSIWENEVKPMFAKTSSLPISEQKEALKNIFDIRKQN